jgi:glycosyltransferase involved in cell wall biosynthesis
MKRNKISVVIPVFNEADTIVELGRRLRQTLDLLALPYDVILVDDGSTDATASRILKLTQDHPQFRWIAFRRNRGKSEALAAGFREATGNIIVMMDADLQDLPEEIPKLLDALETNQWDLVNGRRLRRQDSWFKRLQSSVYNVVTRWATGVAIHDLNCGFKAFRREAISGIELYGELHRYFIALVHHNGFRIGEVPVEHQPRHHGVSKYGYDRIIKGALDLLTIVFLTHFFQSPLYLFGTIGLTLIVLSVGGTLYYEVLGTYAYFAGDMTTHFVSRLREIITIMLALIGLLFIGIGLICQMIVHLHRTRRAEQDDEEADGAS